MSGAFKPGPSLAPRMLPKIEKAMLQGGLWMRDRVKESINVGNRDGSQPSKPGEPPRKQTARLFKSIAAVVERGPGMVSALVGTNVKYGRYLEYGTSKMAPRPYLRPALLKHTARAGQVIAKALRQLSR